MLDPFPPPPEWLRAYVAPLADRFALPTLPLHIHEIIFFFLLYQFVQSILSPLLSTALFPKIYPSFNRRNKLNWDIHVVSLLQSVLVNAAALWVMFADEQRQDMVGAGERVLGYSGACGFVQAMATGYFLWDFIVSTLHIKDFGLGLFLHASSALAVYSLGFVSVLFFHLLWFALVGIGVPQHLSNMGADMGIGSSDTFYRDHLWFLTARFSSFTNCRLRSLIFTGSSTNST